VRGRAPRVCLAGVGPVDPVGADPVRDRAATESGPRHGLPDGAGLPIVPGRFTVDSTDIAAGLEIPCIVTGASQNRDHPSVKY
jgi:hypothetical protein